MGYKYKFCSKSLGPQAITKHNSRLESFFIASTTGKLKSMSTALNSRIANTLLSGESNVELIEYLNKSKWNITLNECSAQNNFSKLLDDIVNHKFNGATYRQLLYISVQVLSAWNGAKNTGCTFKKPGWFIAQKTTGDKIGKIYISCTL